MFWLGAYGILFFLPKILHVVALALSEALLQPFLHGSHDRVGVLFCVLAFNLYGRARVDRANDCANAVLSLPICSREDNVFANREVFDLDLCAGKLNIVAINELDGLVAQFADHYLDWGQVVRSIHALV